MERINLSDRSLSSSVSVWSVWVTKKRAPNLDGLFKEVEEHLSGWIIIFRRSLGRFFDFKIEIRFTSQEIVNYFYVGKVLPGTIYPRYVCQRPLPARWVLWKCHLYIYAIDISCHKNALYIPQRYIVTRWTDALLLPLTWAGTSNSCATAKEKWGNKH